MNRRCAAFIAGTLALALSSCADAPTDRAGTDGSTIPATGGWERASAPPLSPRSDPFVTWTGEEVLVVGGTTGTICGPNADCVEPDPGAFVADGAAWDPATDTWRPITPAPAAVWSGWGFGSVDAAVLDGVVVLYDRQQDVWLSYDVAADRWTVLEPPGPGFLDLSQHDGSRIWGLRRDAVVSWDPRTGEVRTERTYAETPRLDDPRLVLTDVGPVVTGVRYDDPAPDEPTLAQVDLPDGDGWRRVTTGQIGWFYAEVAGLVVGSEPGGADGGEVNGWGRWYPQGGVLDPRTGDWRALDVPDGTGWSTDDWRPQVFGDTEVVTSGHFRDLADSSGRWLRTGRPDTDVSGGNLAATWAGDRLAVLGGTTTRGDRYQLVAPELWLWTPPVS
ncbi:hypothetical protein J2X46_003900 [Nocardioides sp. BE266]|uniref:hypothetical protein n=1 Tax=Nocardioides sp. BE266 TaxID=2817725 RepID=UPI0028593A2E|nr:hypothetical protein [Nocardioides sp. BE266]MDR7254902.1 hypothetical protein [Nocardioides sp. BE266]